MNPQTNITLKSASITLHREEKATDKTKVEEVMRVIGIGSTIVVVMLLVVGSVLVMKWRINASNKTDSRALCRSCVRRQTDSEEPERPKRLSHDQATHDRVSIMTKRLNSPNNSREDIEDQNRQNPYSIIDDDALTDAGLGIENVIYKNSHETRRSTAHIFYDYARSVEMCHVDTGDVHATNEAYITPINDLGEQTYMNEAYENYITPL